MKILESFRHNLPSVLTTFPVALLLLLVSTSCDDLSIGTSSSTGSSSGTGSMEVLLHDNPADYDELWIDVQRVEVNNVQDPDTGWVAISEPQQRYNLLELVNGAQEFLGEAELDEGTYRQIRLILGDDNELVVNGEAYPLKTPSAQNSGLKLNIDAEIQEGMSYTLHIDFDASRSIVVRGNGRDQGNGNGNGNGNGFASPYLLKPVLRAYTEMEAGTVSGVVVPAETNPWIYAIAEEDTLSSTRAEENTGEFRLMGLPENTYTISVEPAEDDYEPLEIPDVEVTAGEDTDLGEIELTEVEEEEAEEEE